MIREKDKSKVLNHKGASKRDVLNYAKKDQQLDEYLKTRSPLINEKEAFTIYSKNKTDVDLKKIATYDRSQLTHAFKALRSDDLIESKLFVVWENILKLLENQSDFEIDGFLGTPTKLVFDNLLTSTMLEAGVEFENMERFENEKNTELLQIDAWNDSIWVKEQNPNEVKLDVDFISDFHERRMKNWPKMTELFRGTSANMVFRGRGDIVILEDYQKSENLLQTHLQTLEDNYSNIKDDLSDSERIKDFLLHVILVSFEISKNQIFMDGNKRMSRTFITMALWKYLGLEFAPDLVSYNILGKLFDNYSSALNDIWTDELPIGVRERDLTITMIDSLYDGTNKYLKSEIELKNYLTLVAEDTKDYSRNEIIKKLDVRVIHLIAQGLIYNRDMKELRDLKNEIVENTGIEISYDQWKNVKNAIRKWVETREHELTRSKFRYKESSKNQLKTILRSEAVFETIREEKEIKKLKNQERYQKSKSKKVKIAITR